MHATTSNRVRNDGQPFAATISAPKANGSAKIVWENRISRRNRAMGPSPNSVMMLARGSKSEEQGSAIIRLDSPANVGSSDVQGHLLFAPFRSVRSRHLARRRRRGS